MAVHLFQPLLNQYKESYISSSWAPNSEFINQQIDLLWRTSK